MKKKLGEILVASGVVSAHDIEAALGDQSAGEPSRLGDLLVATGKLTSTQLAQALGEQYEIPFVDLPPLPQAVLDLVPLELQRQFRFVPLQSQGTELSIAMADLSNVEVVAILEQQWTKVHLHVAGGDEIDALHNTLSGIFKIPGPELPNVAPSISPMSAADELFGGFELEPLEPMPSPVPAIAPVEPRPSPAHVASSPPRVEDLFGDLNLESVRTGIASRPPEDEAAAPPAAQPLAPPVDDEPEPELIFSDPPTDPDAIPEGSGPVLMGIRDGTGPLLDMLADGGGTGPVVDTPFFTDASVGQLVPPMNDFLFSSPSSLAALEASSPHPMVGPPVPDSSPSSPGEPLPDWLKGDAAPAPVSAAPAAGGSWSGALDHLAPSKLVVGLTRALLARGLVTEGEILAALGQKK